MFKHATRAAFVLCAIALASCVSQSAQDDDAITVTGERVIGREVEASQRPPPPPPPPPPVAEMRAPMIAGGIAGGRAQMQPQPLPGDIDRENYEDTDTNPIHLVSDDPVSSFSVDVIVA